MQSGIGAMVRRRSHIEPTSALRGVSVAGEDRLVKSRGLKRSRRGGELEEFVGEGFDASPQGFGDGIAHGQLEAAFHLFIGLDAQRAHGLNGPPPDVVFFLAAALVAVEADDVVAHLVKEDGQTDGSPWIRGLDPSDDGAVGKMILPGAAGHPAAPPFHTNIVPGFDPPDERRKLRHRSVLSAL